MAKFYHLDRGNLLMEGQTIELVKYNDILSNDNSQLTEKLQNHYNNLFPNGVTMHGDGYFAKSNNFTLISPSLELVFEYVRKANFLDKPSRAQSFFAVEPIHDIFRFADILNVDVHNLSVWEVECETYHRANMRLLSVGSSNLVTSYYANEYWSGGTASDTEPFWEYLLVPPVKIVRRITIL